MANAHSSQRKELIICEIMGLLNTHKTYQQMLVSNVPNWGISKSTFNRYIQEARERNKEQLQTINNNLMKRTEQHQLNLLKKGLYSKEQIVFKMQKILDTSKGTTDKIRAAKLICDIMGYIAPVKTELDIVNLTPIFRDNPLLDGYIDITEDQTKLPEDTTDYTDYTDTPEGPTEPTE